MEDGHATEQHEDLEDQFRRPPQPPGMYVLQLGREGLTERLLFGSYTVFAPEVGGFMVLANAPVSAVPRKTRNKRSMAFKITEGVFMQNPMAVKFSRKGGSELDLV